jgi:FYVE zinc finger
MNTDYQVLAKKVAEDQKIFKVVNDYAIPLIENIVSLCRSPLHLWVPDASSGTCKICTVKFTFINRRHHCRWCGSLICGKCSPETKVIFKPLTSDKKVIRWDKSARICKICVMKYPDIFKSFVLFHNLELHIGLLTNFGPSSPNAGTGLKNLKIKTLISITCAFAKDSGSLDFPVPINSPVKTLPIMQVHPAFRIMAPKYLNQLLNGDQVNTALHITHSVMNVLEYWNSNKSHPLQSMELMKLKTMFALAFFEFFVTQEAHPDPLKLNIANKHLWNECLLACFINLESGCYTANSKSLTADFKKSSRPSTEFRRESGGDQLRANDRSALRAQNIGVHRTRTNRVLSTDEIAVQAGFDFDTANFDSRSFACDQSSPALFAVDSIKYSCPVISQNLNLS